MEAVLSEYGQMILLLVGLIWGVAAGFLGDGIAMRGGGVADLERPANLWPRFTAAEALGWTAQSEWRRFLRLERCSLIKSFRFLC